ncbi:MAG: hypothetical protein JW727_00120 [Candidatus Aenigmarchaeota archaeon]|nr:hypothetical protein [Candidatus Aenigmarchaeota archaeon]
MEGLLLMGLEIAFFFGVIFFLEYRRHISAAAGGGVFVSAQPRVYLTNRNIDKASVLFAEEFRKILDASEKGYVSFGTQDLYTTIKKLESNFEDARRTGN